MVHSFTDIYKQIYEHLDDKELEAQKSTQDLLRFIAQKAEETESLKNLKQTEKKSFSREECLVLKDLGLVAFQKQDHGNAIHLYSRFLELCASAENKDEFKDLLHQGYSGRAAVLYSIGNFRLCIDDLKSALDLSESRSSNAYLLLDRKAKCLLELGRVNEAKEDFKKALETANASDKIVPGMKEVFAKQIDDNLAKLTTEEEKRLKEDVEKREDFFSLLISEDDKKSDFLRTTPNVVWNEKAQISYGGPEVGRLLRANQDIQPGEIIAIESPLASFTQCDNGTSKVCHHCLGNFYMNGAIFFPSPVVTGIRFCSYDCLHTALNSYHTHEQFVLADYLRKLSNDKESVELSGCMFLAFRAVVRRPSGFYTTKIAKEIMSKTDVRYGCEKILPGEMELDEELRFLWSLVDHDKNESLESKVRMAIRSAILLRCLQKSDYFTDYKAQHFAVLWALYKLQMSMTYNIHTVYRVGGNISGDIPLSAVGSAVYRNLVLLNHSCATNTTRFYHGKRTVLVAKRLIRSGEEISNNYGSHHLQLPKDKRQVRLKEDYKFDCRCDACQKDFPTLRAAESDFGKKHKALKKQLETILMNYQASFQAGSLKKALGFAEEYLRKLSEAGIKYPHRNYEIGAIAMNSCWWAIIAQDHAGRLD